MAQAIFISNAKYNRPKFANMSYYGVIENIWELYYTMLHVLVFSCKWVMNNNDIKVDELGFILVDLTKAVTKRTHSYWPHKQNKYFISQILLIKSDHCSLDEAKNYN